MMNVDPYTIVDLDKSAITAKTLEHKNSGYRLAQICAVRTAGGYDLFYSFAKEYEFINYKIAIGEDDEILSISEIFPTAMLYENEMKEFFGVNIKSINLDYDNRFIRIAQETPFK